MNIKKPQLDAIIICAGQAGLAAGRLLQQHALRFLIIDEQGAPGGNWRNYYESLQLFSPAEYSALPGQPFPGPQKNYPTRDQVVAYLEGYAEHFRLPIRQGARVAHVRTHPQGFEVQTANGESLCAKSVVVASGGFNRPYVPDIPGLGMFEGRVIHSAQYRSTYPFHGERVVVIGAANSAVQIAYELANVAVTTLATREKIRFFPQRMLGVDFHTWLKWTGFGKTRWLTDQGTPVLDQGKYRRAIRSGLLQRKPMFTRLTSDGVIWADDHHETVDSLIFATGFQPNISFLDNLPVRDQHGRLLQKNGVAQTLPGLFFVGLPRQRNFASATLRGVGPDAEYILPHLIRHLKQAQSSQRYVG